MSDVKPLGQKAYGHIPHLPGSRMGPADHHCHEGQARICTERARDRRDLVIVQEKLDGSCVSAAKVNGEIVALGRAGFLAKTSPYPQHHLFSDWVDYHRERFASVLAEGERVVGEWLAQAHGTRYSLHGEPFVAFDLMSGKVRAPVATVRERLGGRFVLPHVIHEGGPIPVADVLAAISVSHHGALDPVEGAVWRVERAGVVDFLAKYVRPDKVDGCYLPEVTGRAPIWNLWPLMREAA